MNLKSQINMFKKLTKNVTKNEMHLIKIEIFKFKDGYYKI